MPQIGWLEILIIVVLAVLVIGPKDFPIVIRKVGSWIGTIKGYFRNIQTEMDQFKDTIDLENKDLTEKNNHIEKKDNKKTFEEDKSE